MITRATNGGKAAHPHALAFVGQRLRNRQLSGAAARVAAARGRRRLRRHRADAALGARLAFFFFLFFRRLTGVQQGDLGRGGFTGSIGDPLALLVLFLLGFGFGLLLAFGFLAQAVGFVGGFLFLLLDAPQLFHLALATTLGVERDANFGDRLGNGPIGLRREDRGVVFGRAAFLALRRGTQEGALAGLALFIRQLAKLRGRTRRGRFGAARRRLGLGLDNLGRGGGDRRLQYRPLRLDLDGHLLRPAMRELLANLGRGVRAAPLQFKLGPARQAQDFLRFLLFILAHDSPVSTSSPVPTQFSPMRNLSLKSQDGWRIGDITCSRNPPIIRNAQILTRDLAPEGAIARHSTSCRADRRAGPRRR